LLANGKKEEVNLKTRDETRKILNSWHEKIDALVMIQDEEGCYLMLDLEFDPLVISNQDVVDLCKLYDDLQEVAAEILLLEFNTMNLVLSTNSIK